MSLQEAIDRKYNAPARPEDQEEDMNGLGAAESKDHEDTAYDVDHATDMNTTDRGANTAERDEDSNQFTDPSKADDAIKQGIAMDMYHWVDIKEPQPGGPTVRLALQDRHVATANKQAWNMVEQAISWMDAEQHKQAEEFEVAFKTLYNVCIDIGAFAELNQIRNTMGDLIASAVMAWIELQEARELKKRGWDNYAAMESAKANFKKAGIYAYCLQNLLGLQYKVQFNKNLWQAVQQGAGLYAWRLNQRFQLQPPTMRRAGNTDLRDDLPLDF